MFRMSSGGERSGGLNGVAHVGAEAVSGRESGWEAIADKYKFLLQWAHVHVILHF